MRERAGKGPGGQSREAGPEVSQEWRGSDESLLQAFAFGERTATDAFVRRFQGRVFGLALAILGDPHAAEDAAQETFVRAWRYAGGYDRRRGSVTTWLLTIARNTALTARGVAKTEPTDPGALAALPVADLDADPEEYAIADVESQELRRAIASLPEDQRRALVMAAFQGRTAKEISGTEGIPLGTAKTRIRSAVLKLRTALERGDER